MTARSAPFASVPGFEILDMLNQHRYLTLSQVTRWHYGDDTARTRNLAYSLLVALKRRGFVEAAPVEARGVAVYFLSEKGLKAVPVDRRRDYVPTAVTAAGMDHIHTWAGNEVGLAFARAARERDDEFGPLALDHEIKLRDTGSRGSLVIADGILQYVEVSAGRIHTAVVEVDRTTKPVRIANRLRAYSEIKRKKALWTKILPDGWPPVLFVVSDDPPGGLRVGQKHWAGDPARSEARCGRLVSYVGAAAKTEPALGALEVLFCSLPALIESGPFAAIWHRPGASEPAVDWLGRRTMRLAREGGGAA